MDSDSVEEIPSPVEMIQIIVDNDDGTEQPQTIKALFTEFKPVNSDGSEVYSEIDEQSTDQDMQPLTKRMKRERNEQEMNPNELSPKKRHYLQRYKKDWENIPAFKQWLSESVKGNLYFYCKFCKNDNKCGKTEIEKHMVSKKHLRNAKLPQLKIQKKFNFHGLLCPVFTPFENNRNNDINCSIIPEYAKYLKNCGIKGVLVNDIVGEGMSLTSSERMKLIEEWSKACEQMSLHLMVQVGGGPLKDVQEMIRYAEKKKVNSVLILPDVYNKPESHLDLLRYLKIVSDSANTLPILYHHFPKYTNVNIDITALLNDVIGEIDSFVGVIFSCNDLDKAVSALTINDDKFTIFIGSDEIMLGAFSSGFTSLVGTTLNLFPKIAQSILHLTRMGDLNTARETQRFLKSTIGTITHYGRWIPTMKAAMNILTPVNVGPPRPPLVSLWNDKVKKMEAELKLSKVM